MNKVNYLNVKSYEDSIDKYTINMKYCDINPKEALDIFNKCICEYGFVSYYHIAGLFDLPRCFEDITTIWTDLSSGEIIDMYLKLPKPTKMAIDIRESLIHGYLSLVIEPFRDKVIDRCKLSSAFDEFISIHVGNELNEINEMKKESRERFK